MKTKKPCLFIALIFCSFSFSFASDVYTIKVGATSRQYLLHLPDTYTGTDSLPLVISLHLLGSTASQFEALTGFSTLADRYNFIAVYPSGIGNSWNGGGCCSPSTDQNIDDVQFISDLIDTLKANYNIDSTRIYVDGFSNGSIMTYRLANELSGKIAAIGCVAGQSFQDEINPDHPVSIIHFHALDDTSVDFDGGTNGSYTYKPVLDVLAAWKEINGCSSDSVVIRDEDGIKGYLWTSSDDQSNIILYTSNAGGHSWNMNSRMGISNLMWEFFSTGRTQVPARYDTIKMDGLQRSFKVNLPSEYYTGLLPDSKYPLIMAFHGWDQDADAMEAYTKLSNKGNREDFMVSYLNYVGPPPDNSWNYFMTPGKPDDIGFATKVLDTLIAQYPVDTERIFLVGFSDGCGMADRLPFALPGRIKGIGTVSGMIEFDNTVETNKVPLIHINYTGDGAWSGIQSKIPYWVALNGCNDEADTTVNARSVVGRRWENADGKNHVVVISTGGGSHEWVSTNYVNATNLMWEFFETGNAIPNVDTPTYVKPVSIGGNELFDIYPNPASERLNLKPKSPGLYISGVSMYDNTGMLVFEWNTKDLKANRIIWIDLSRYGKGLYYLRVAYNNAVLTEKLIIE
jgi:polyhydroxybutyrate depolymerase